MLLVRHAVLPVSGSLHQHFGQGQEYRHVAALLRFLLPRGRRSRQRIAFLSDLPAESTNQEAIDKRAGSVRVGVNRTATRAFATRIGGLCHACCISSKKAPPTSEDALIRYRASEPLGKRPHEQARAMQKSAGN